MEDEDKIEVRWDRCIKGEEEKPWMVISVIGGSRFTIPCQYQRSFLESELVKTAKGYKKCWIVHQGKRNNTIRQFIAKTMQYYKTVERYNTPPPLSTSPENSCCICCNSNSSRVSSSENNKTTTTIPCIEFLKMSSKKDFKGLHKKIIIDNNPCKKRQNRHLLMLEEIADQMVRVSKTSHLQGRKTSEFYIKIPVVVLMMEGDSTTIEHLSELLSLNIPVIVVKGSGGAADCVMEYLESREDILTQLAQSMKMQHHPQFVEQMQNIKKNRNLVSAFDVNENSPLSIKVSETLENVWFHNGVTLLQKINHESYDTYCPVEDYKDFVESIKEWVDPSSSSLFFYMAYHILKSKTTLDNPESKRKFVKNRVERGEILCVLLTEAIYGDQHRYVAALLEEPEIVIVVSMQFLYSKIMTCKCKEGHCHHLYAILKDCYNTSVEAEESACNHVRDKILQFVQNFLHYPINGVTALLSSTLLRTLADIQVRINSQHLTEKLEKNAGTFEQQLLSFIYEEDSEAAIDLLETSCTVWGITTTPLQCAYDNNMYEFTAHTCVQKYMNKIWYNKVGPDCMAFCKNGGYSTMLQRLTAPYTYCVLHYILYLGVIAVFSAFVLTDVNTFENDSSIGIYEWIFYTWVLLQIILEIMVKVHSPEAGRKTKMYRLYRYFLDFWRAVDVLFLALTFIAIMLRFSSVPIQWARRTYSISLLTYMRFLDFLLIFPKVGTFVIMMTEMVKDLARFFFILFVFMMSAGVMYHANMYPNHTDMWSTNGMQYWRIWKIISLPYWQIYGELFLDKFEDKSDYECTRNQTVWESNPEIERCVEYDSITLVIAAVYMLISNLLLVNLVIAVFSVRFEKVLAMSEKLWRYNRCSLVLYHKKKCQVIMAILFCCFCHRCSRKSETGSSEQEQRLEEQREEQTHEKQREEQKQRLVNLQEIYSNRCT